MISFLLGLLERMTLVVRELTDYANCVNIYAGCVNHRFSMRCSRRSARKSLLLRSCLPARAGICLNSRTISEPRRPASNGNSKGSPQAVFSSAVKTAGGPTTRQTQLRPSSANCAPCWPRRQALYRCSSPNSRLSGAASNGPRFTAPSPEVRNEPPATSIFSWLEPWAWPICCPPYGASNSVSGVRSTSPATRKLSFAPSVQLTITFSIPFSRVS